jgi:hypothetical protein
MMVPPDASRGLDGVPHRSPGVTQRQRDTAEHVCAWLGSEAGQEFLAARERELEAYDAHERARHREANRTGVRPTHGMTAQGLKDYFVVLRKATTGAEGRRGAA